MKAILLAAAAAPLTHADFTARFDTTTTSYELTRSYDYAAGPITASSVKKQMECVEQSGDGCDRYGCVATVRFPLASARLRLQSADGLVSFEVSQPGTLELWEEQKDCNQPLEVTAGISHLTQSDNIMGISLEGRPVQALIGFSGHGRLALNATTGAVELDDFDFDDSSWQVIDLKDDCLQQPSVFGPGCRATFREGLRRRR